MALLNRRGVSWKISYVKDADIRRADCSYIPLISQVPVWAVLDYTRTSCISRELLLCKISILGPEYAEQQMTGGPTHAPEVPSFVTADGQETQSHHVDAKFERERAIAQNFEKSGSSLPGNLSCYASNGQHNPLGASEALIAKHLHLRSVKTLTEQFGGRVVDVAENSVIIELTAKTARVEAFLSLMRPFGVLEAVRSGESRYVRDSGH